MASSHSFASPRHRRSTTLRGSAGLAAVLVLTGCGVEVPSQPDVSAAQPALQAGASALCALPLLTAPSWHAVQQHGDIPTAIWEAGASFGRAGSGDSDVVYRFGGQSGNFPTDLTVNDFYALDLATATWTNLASPQTPTARADTLMIPGPCGNCVSVIGGRGRFRSGSDLMFPEMWTYHVNSHDWESVPAVDLGDPLAVRRSSALVVAVPELGHPDKKTSYAFGGVGNTLPRFATTATGLRNDVAVYDKDAGWSLVTTSGARPAPRAWAAGGYDPATHSLLVFGGYRLGADQGPTTPPGELFGPTNYENDLWSLDLTTLTWTELHPTGTLPSPRDNAVAFFDSAHGGLVTFGGEGAGGSSDELWFYSMADNQWTLVALDPGAALPPTRVGGV
ncbi:MAG: kelch repeat-containing protein, partial [Byssovorax sp.]